MSENFPEIPTGAMKPDVFEFEWPRDADLPEMRWLRSFVRFGLPVEMRQSYDTAKMLQKIDYDGTPDQEAARVHIAAAIELFRKSYSDWSVCALDEANRIITEHAGEISVDGQPVVGADLIHEPDGEVRLRLLTHLSENS
jgi:hypothetical protein